MREFINMVTESTDPKALKARLRTIQTDRKYIITGLLPNTGARAATALAEGRDKDYADAMERITSHIRQVADLEREADTILAQLNA